MPFAQRLVRWQTDAAMEFMMVLAMWKYRRFRPLNTAATVISRLLCWLSIRDPRVRRDLRPDYDYGCKRPTMSNSYYRTFNQPHVHLDTSGIDHIEPDGIVTRDGGKRRVDVLVLATGFNVWDSNMPGIEVIGRDGRNLGKWWRENRFQAYRGMSVPQFPNFLNLASPYAWLGLSWFNTVECEMRHMRRLLGEVQRRRARTFEVTEEANDRFLQRMTRLLGDSVFYAGNCATSNSYWFNNDGDAPLFRPTSVRNAVAEQDRFPLNDYLIA